MKVFKPNGCSWWPDGNYLSCCDQHDLDYFYGGSRLARKASDARLFECVAKQNSYTMAWVMWIGVRVFGHPWMPARSWRWGYSHRYPRSSGVRGGRR